MIDRLTEIKERLAALRHQWEFKTNSVSFGFGDGSYSFLYDIKEDARWMVAEIEALRLEVQLLKNTTDSLCKVNR